MIDYYLKFADEAAAKTALAQYLNNGEWPLDKCIPGIQLWRASQDVPDGQGGVTHTYLTGYFILISLNNVVPALRDAAVVQVVLDRDLAIKRRVGAVIKSNVSNAVLQDIRWQPQWLGDDPAYGNQQ